MQQGEGAQAFWARARLELLSEGERGPLRGDQYKFGAAARAMAAFAAWAALPLLAGVGWMLKRRYEDTIQKIYHVVMEEYTLPNKLKLQAG